MRHVLVIVLMTCQLLQENLQKWLMDEKARDQFVIRAGTDTEVLWNDARQSKPELVYKRSVSELHIYNLSVLVFQYEHSYLFLRQ